MKFKIIMYVPILANSSAVRLPESTTDASVLFKISSLVTFADSNCKTLTPVVSNVCIMIKVEWFNEDKCWQAPRKSSGEISSKPRAL